jgi:carbon monoxide dehydrogenase subunit G
MISVEQSIFINRSPEDVFTFVAEPTNITAWQADVVSAEPTSEGPSDIGSTVRLTQKSMGRDMVNDLEITIWEPPHRMCFQSTAGPIEFTGCQHCEESGGGTKFTWSIEGEMGGFFKVAEGIVAKQLEKTVGENLDRLKSILEG